MFYDTQSKEFYLISYVVVIFGLTTLHRQALFWRQGTCLLLTCLFFTYSQYEAKMKTLEADMKEMESKKRILEEAVDSLNEEIAKLKAKGNIQNCLLLRCNLGFSLPAT